MPRGMTLRSEDRDYRVEIDGDRVMVDGVRVQIPGRAYSAADGDTTWVFVDGELYEFEVVRAGRKRGAAAHGSLTAPMPATVIRINTPAGTQVKRGETLLVLGAAGAAGSSVPWFLGTTVSGVLQGPPFVVHSPLTGPLYMLQWPAALHLALVSPSPAPVVAIETWPSTGLSATTLRSASSRALS